MARTKKLDDRELLARLLDLFREHGFEGVSLAALSAATGLEKASLYYRFPGGKADMAEAVLRYVDEWYATHIVAPLEQADRTPAERVRIISANLRKFYGDGRSNCVVNTLSLSGTAAGIRAHVKSSTQAVLAAFARVSRDSGFPPAAARRRAEEALGSLEGALVVARAIGDASAFRRAIDRLPSQLTGA